MAGLQSVTFNAVRWGITFLLGESVDDDVAVIKRTHNRLRAPGSVESLSLSHTPLSSLPGHGKSVSL